MRRFNFIFIFDIREINSYRPVQRWYSGEWHITCLNQTEYQLANGLDSKLATVQLIGFIAFSKFYRSPTRRYV